MSKKTVDWAAIKSRYIAGESPSSIAKDFMGTDAVKIRARASRERWLDLRKTYMLDVVDRSYANIEEVVKSNATLALELESKLLKAQIAIIDRGNEFFEFISDAITAFAMSEETSPKDFAGIVNELRDCYKAIIAKYIPPNVVATVFKTARPDYLSTDEREKIEVVLVDLLQDSDEEGKE